MDGGHAERITLEWDGEWWTVSDEGGEFARATEPTQALRYVLDLMTGPPTYLKGLAALLDGRLHGKTEPLRDDAR
jgi:hypothetical protein